MKSRKMTLFLSLVVFSLACLGAPAVAPTDQSELVRISPTLTNGAGAAAGLDTPLSTLPAHEKRCALVVADTALNLRGGASVDDVVLSWLLKGEVVRLVDDSNPDWWRVKLEGFEGWARSIYLRESECRGKNGH